VQDLRFSGRQHRLARRHLQLTTLTRHRFVEQTRGSVSRHHRRTALAAFAHGFGSAQIEIRHAYLVAVAGQAAGFENRLRLLLDTRALRGQRRRCGSEHDERS
jgi:hypothetical protein